MRGASGGGFVGGGAGGPVSDQCVTREITALEAVSETLESTRILVERVETLAARLLGPVPCNPAIGKDISPSGVLPSMYENASAVRRRLTDAFDAISRIESSLP